MKGNRANSEDAKEGGRMSRAAGQKESRLWRWSDELPMENLKRRIVLRL
jgi:hypothetical protein